MATSGSTRRHLAGLVLGALVLLVAACSSPGPGPEPDASPSIGSSGPSAAPTVPTAGPTVAAGAPCRVELPAAWSTALAQGTVQPRGAEHLDVVLATGDGRVFVVTARGGRQRLEWRRGAQTGLVQDFGRHDEWQVLAPTWDGRHLAYRVDHSFSNFEDFSVLVWDSQADAPPVEVAHGEPGPDGELMQTPFVDPVLADGWVYWTQTRDADPGHTVLSGRRLADGRVERLHRGYGRAPVRFGDDLVWTDSDKAGQPTELRMLDLTTRREVEVPAALGDARNVSSLAGDADTLAWVTDPKGMRVSVWRSGWPAPRLLVADAPQAEFPRVAGQTVVFTGSDAMYVADLRSWSYARLTPEYGGVWADGGPVAVVSYRPVAADSPSVQTLVDTDAVGPLGRAGC